MSSETSPENDAYLRRLIDRSPLLADPTLRRHWKRVAPVLSIAARYELAAILVRVERHVACA